MVVVVTGLVDVTNVGAEITGGLLAISVLLKNAWKKKLFRFSRYKFFMIVK